jgi:hypothetical protein
MKKIHLICCFLIINWFRTGCLFAVLSYSMVPTVAGFVSVSGTNIPDLSAGSDFTITNPIAIGFAFKFDNINYTHFQASDNGFIHLTGGAGSTTLTGTGYGNASGDVIIPNDFTVSNTLQPFIAPLWEELAISGLSGGGSTTYTVTGSSPTRTLIIQYNKVSWRAPTATDQISFQIILHETSNIIDFVYKVGAVALGSFPTASIGLGGVGATNYYSLSSSGTNPTAAVNSNVTNISTRPADGQRYRWIPTATLPIELMFLSGEHTDLGNLLQWKTASEHNNDFFTIERSVDANYFEAIGFVKGSGNSETIRAYSYTDASFYGANNLVYYRLKQTDYDRTADYSPIISIDMIFSQKKPTVAYFDKSSGELNLLQNYNYAGLYRMQIIDMMGKVVDEQELEITKAGSNLSKKSLSFPTEGTFIIRILEPGGMLLSQLKFIK